MRHKRAIHEKGDGYYHVISRISGQRFLINDEEKKIFLSYMRRAAEFCGVDVFTFALMDNHFHLLVRVREPHEVTEEELRSKMTVLYGRRRAEKIFEDWDVWASKPGSAVKVELAKQALVKRMFSLSQFCKTFKEVYTMDYNKRTGNTGTIWESRFKSMLLDSNYRTLMTVAAYIDMNPVRAGIVEDASESRWNGIGTAVSGDAESRNGLVQLVRHVYRRNNIGWSQTHEVYTATLEGDIRGNISLKSPARRQKFSALKVREKLRNSEKLNDAELLHCKVRNFSYGVALGVVEFVKETANRLGFWKNSDNTSGMICCEQDDLRTARRLRGGGEVTLPTRYTA